MTQPSQNIQIACNLNDAQFRERRELARRILLGDIQSIERQPLELILAFNNNPAVEENVQVFIELEKQCCGFLTFDIQPSDSKISVHVSGPNGSEGTIDTFERIASESRR